MKGPKLNTPFKTVIESQRPFGDSINHCLKGANFPWQPREVMQLLLTWSKNILATLFTLIGEKACYIIEHVSLRKIICFFLCGRRCTIPWQLYPSPEYPGLQMQV